MAELATHGFALVLATSRGQAASDVQRALRCASADELVALLPPEASTAAPSADAEADADSEGAREALVEAWHELRSFQEVGSHLTTALRLVQWLPGLDVPKFVVDRDVRVASIAELSVVSTPAAFEEARLLACKESLDEWSLRMASLRSSLVSPREGGEGWQREGVRAALSQHEETLLADPPRLCTTLVEDVLPSVPHDGTLLVTKWGGSNAPAAASVAVVSPSCRRRVAAV